MQAGTALSTRVRAGAPNSVNLVRYEPTQDARRCVIERWDCAPGATRFELAASHTLSLADNAAVKHAG